MRIGFAHGCNQLFDLLASRMSVHRAGILDDREIQRFTDVDNVFLRNIDHRSDNGDIRAGQERIGMEGMQPPLKDHGHHQRFDGVFSMMTQRDFVTSKRPRGIDQRASAHFGAKRTGVGFLTDIENNRRDLRVNDGIGNAEFRAPRADGRYIERFKSILSVTACKEKSLFSNF